MGCPPLFLLFPISATSASLRFLRIGPKRASGEGCDEWSRARARHTYSSSLVKDRTLGKPL
jgi:hypothetical protein